MKICIKGCCNKKVKSWLFDKRFMTQSSFGVMLPKKTLEYKQNNALKS